MIDQTIREETIYVTSDGVRHSSPEMARQHLAYLEISALFEKHAAYGEMPVDRILNIIGDNRKAIREYLDITDAMLDAAMK